MREGRVGLQAGLALDAILASGTLLSISKYEGPYSILLCDPLKKIEDQTVNTESVIEDSSTGLHPRNKIPTLVAKDATRMGHPVFQIKITDVGRGCPTHTTHTAGLSSAEKLRRTGRGLRRLNLR